MGEIVLFDLVFIFFARVIDVSLNTVRTILMVKGRRYIAALIGFFEVLVYILALGKLLGSLGNPVRLIVYCAGFACGILVGTIIEERLALGYLGVQIITSCANAGLADYLRENGHGVTTWTAYGKDGEKLIIHVMLPRKAAGQLEEVIRQQNCSDHTFLIFSEPKMFRGGFIQRK